MVGWWRNPLYGGCLCPAEPECQYGDCQSIDWQGFTADGTSVSGTVAWSKNNKTMSEEGAVDQTTYTVGAGGAVTFTRAGQAPFTFNMTCSGNQLTIAGAISVRAEAGLAGALQAATASSPMFKSWPVDF
jgi:hypothetical protein